MIVVISHSAFINKELVETLNSQNANKSGNLVRRQPFVISEIWQDHDWSAVRDQVSRWRIAAWPHNAGQSLEFAAL
jgi:hypothetical protein